MQQLATSFDLVLKIFLRSRMVLQFSHLTCIKLYGLSMAYNVSVATSCITPKQVYRRRYESRRWSKPRLNCIKNKKNKIWRKMNLIHPAMWHDYDIDFAW